MSKLAKEFTVFASAKNADLKNVAEKYDLDTGDGKHVKVNVDLDSPP